MKYDLEERLVSFAVRIIDVAESLPKTRAGNHLAGQLIRSGTSPAFNYGEAQAAESKDEFIHKIKVVLTRVCLTIIDRKGLSGARSVLNDSSEENSFIRTGQGTEERQPLPPMLLKREMIMEEAR